MTGRDYASVPERITWTTGFRVPTDKLVLGALSTFANFKTGEGARMSIDALTMRANLPRRTVERALGRLESDEWITAVRRHRHATTYNICVARLAENWVGAKVVRDLSATGGGQTASPTPDLSATGDHLTAMGGGQNPDLSATGGGPIPCTSDPLYEPSAPALRAGRFEYAGPTTTEAKVEVTDGPSDVRPDGSDHPRRDADEPGRGFQQPAGSDQVSTRGAGVRLPERADPPRAVGHEPRGSPYQPTLGPLDVSETRRQSHWQRVTQLFKDALNQSTGPPKTRYEREKQKRQG